jgi:hypothetical protein
VTDRRAAELAAYLAGALEWRDGALWCQQRRYQLRRIAGAPVPRLGAADQVQLLAGLNATRPPALLPEPITGPELDAYLVAPP